MRRREKVKGKKDEWFVPLLEQCEWEQHWAMPEEELQGASSSCSLAFQVCWLHVASIGQNGSVRTPHPGSCSLPIPQETSTITSIDSLIFTERECLLCTGFSPSSRG